MVEETGLTIPESFKDISDMAKAFVASGYFSDTKAMAQAIVKIQAGKELGLPPVYSMQNINLIRDRLTSSANTLAMMVKKSGRYNYRVTEHSDQSCTITFFESEEGKWVEVGTSTFTMEDAKRANLVKPDSGWVKYPRAMLFSRAISQGARMYAPDAIGGVYTDEEIRSIPPRPQDAEPVTVDPAAGEIIEAEGKEKAQPEPEQDSTPEPSPQATSAKSSPVEDQTEPPLFVTPDTLSKLAKVIESAGYTPKEANGIMLNNFKWPKFKSFQGLTEDQAIHLIEYLKENPKSE